MFVAGNPWTPHAEGRGVDGQANLTDNRGRPSTNSRTRHEHLPHRQVRVNESAQVYARETVVSAFEDGPPHGVVRTAALGKDR